MTTLGAIGEGLAELTLGPEPDSVALDFGGDAANVCVMASRLGVPTRLAGRVGDDALGRGLQRFWGEQGVDLSWVQRDPSADTGLYLNEPDGGGEHRFVYWRTGSAGSRLRRGDLPGGFFKDLAALVVTGITLAVSPSSRDAAEHGVERARKAGISVACILNHRPALGGDPRSLGELAEASDIVIGSLEDVEAIYGDPERGIRALRARRGRRDTVVTDGPRTAIAFHGDRSLSLAVPAVEAVNAAGAGDAFAGAYLATRIEGGSLDAALASAVAAGSLSVQRRGCGSSYPTATEAAAARASLTSTPGAKLAATRTS